MSDTMVEPNLNTKERKIYPDWKEQVLKSFALGEHKRPIWYEKNLLTPIENHFAFMHLGSIAFFVTEDHGARGWASLNNPKKYLTTYYSELDLGNINYLSNLIK